MNSYGSALPDNFPDLCIDNGSLVFTHWLVINFALADNRFGEFARELDLDSESLSTLNKRQEFMDSEEEMTFGKLKEMYNQYLWFFNMDGPDSADESRYRTVRDPDDEFQGMMAHNFRIVEE